MKEKNINGNTITWYNYIVLYPLHTYAFLIIISLPRAFLTQFHQLIDGSLTNLQYRLEQFIKEHEILTYCQIAFINISLLNS